MSLQRTLLAGILVMIPVFVFGQDESELAHFQSFFNEKQGISLEIALHDANLRLEQAREIDDPREEAKALKDLGLIHMTRVHDYEEAIDLFIRALAIEDSLHLEGQQVLTYMAIARIFQTTGDFYKSAEFLATALELNQNGRNINCLAMILINLGKVNASSGKVDEAFENYQRVLRYRDDIATPLETEALISLGHLFSLQGEYDEALESHKNALALSRSRGDRQAEARSLNDIGVIYEHMKFAEKSLANHLVALEIRQSLDDKRAIAESYNNIGWHYQKAGNADNAISNGLLALQNGQESQAQEQIFKSYELLSQAYKAQTDYKNALAYKELSLAIQEFIQSEKQERQLVETQNRYVVGKKETQIQKLDALRLEREREIADQKKFRNILFLLAVLGVVTAGLLFILYLVKRRSNRILSVAKKEVQQQNEKLQELNHTKDKFFSIISHDLKGPLNSLTSFSRLLIDHTDSMSKEEIQLLAKDLDKSVKNLLTLLENLLEWSRSQTGAIDFTPEQFDLCNLLETNKTLLEPQARNKRITISLDHPGEFPVWLHKQSINTVLRNLMSNAIKFTPEGGMIRAGIKVENSRILVFITDNGVGMSAEIVDRLFRLGSKHSTRGTADEKGTGLGLILCREFVERNGGKIDVKSSQGKGSAFTCSFPLTIRVRVSAVASEPVSR